ncbi:LytTR family transcriptional regulator [Hoeflea sp. WL0058]|uniref:LytTR family transcriptional regulator n=1 Tax=Flavimaribacter sediminis TaxID=2865987 RepID=A0AAE3D284_9HYPH|nr:LytTR family transcriptional regulator [Flavimaribacter sediminis]
MADNTLQLTLREWWRSLSSPRTLTVLLVAGAIFGLAGPFGTYEALRPLPRILYWLAVTIVTYAVGLLSGRLMREHTPLKRLEVVPAYAIAGLIGGIPIALCVLAINVVAGFTVTETGLGLTRLVFYGCLISLCISAVLAWVQRDVTEKPDDPTSPIPAGARLMKRLPVELRGKLQYLTVQDHYVEVVTDKGSYLVLMRLGDAIAETAPVEGLRIHRSHWVALSAVGRIRREGDRLLVETVGGAVLPVSRSHRAALREAGLVPVS